MKTFTWLLCVLASLLTAEAMAQQPTPSGFDYRFDVQFNSTVHPSVRWFARQSAEVQRQHYHRLRQIYPHRLYGIPTLGPCGVEYVYFLIDTMPPIEGMPASAAASASSRSSSAPHPSFYTGTSSEPAADRSPETAARRSVWISRHAVTGAESILFVPPADTATATFYRATARLDARGHVTDLQWIDQPWWGSNRGTVTTVRSSATGADQSF
ncbi:MAG: hypothetical protein RIK87_05335 [Fuerstiella sp.]